MSTRSFRTQYIALAVTLVLLVARVVTLVIDDSKTTGWGWITLAAAIAAFVLAIGAYLDARGKLNRYRNRGLAALTLVLGLALGSVVIVTANNATPQLGLDLQGGFSVVLTPEGDPPSENIDQAMTIIRQRIDGLGVAEPEVTRQGDNVVVELPGVEDREAAQEIVGRTAQLEFRPVLIPGLPYDSEAAANDEDPCAAAAELASGAASAEGEGVVPGDPTAPGDPAAEEPVDPADPAATTVPLADPEAEPAPAEGDTTDEGASARPAPLVGGVTDGQSAAGPVLGRQEDGTTTTAPADDATTTTAADGATTTVPADGTATTVPDDGATTTAPAEEAPVEEAPTDEAGDTVVLPTQDQGDEVPRSCVQMGAIGFGGDALSRSAAELGGPAGSEWVVSVTIRGSQRPEANELFNACFAGAPTCPAAGGGNGQLAIVLDDEVVSAPAVNSQNLADDDFQISGGGGSGFRESEAKDLALVLRYGALPVEFTRSAERQVSPTLGEDSLQAGILAGVIGLVAVAIYLLLYYRALGLVVVAGLGVWAALMYGVVCWLSATQGLTLSLAGVVGIVVSVGTTVDSYVVHFERLKDEVRQGKTVRASTEKGFQRAFRTILTADIASLIGAALLWWLTVGAVRGFAFFLGLSVVLDIFVAYCFDRPMVGLLARSKFFTENRIFGVARGLGRTSDGQQPQTPVGAST